MSIGFVVAVVGFATSIASGHLVAQDAITRVSVDSNGQQTVGWVRAAALSSDGRHVAFASDADSLVANDGNQCCDVFVHDRVTGATVRVSVDSAGVEGDGDSDSVAISADGRFVAFASLADNFVANDANDKYDVFVHDRDPDGNGVFDEGNGTTTLVSVAMDGNPTPHAWSTDPSICGDGHLVAFCSSATTLVPGDTNRAADIFVRDLSAGTTTRVDVDSNGKQATNGSSYLPFISEDGSAVAFESDATNLAAGDSNHTFDVFVRDLVQGTTTRVSIDSAGNESDDRSYSAALSADGSLAMFTSSADNLVPGDTNDVDDVFVHDRATGTTERCSVDSGGNQVDAYSGGSAISGDGEIVAFVCASSSLAPGNSSGQAEAYVHERSSGRTYLASARCGVEPDSVAGAWALSRDGNLLAFISWSDNLVGGDDNGYTDAFIFDRTVDLATTTTYGSGYAGSNGIPTLTENGAAAVGGTFSLEITDSSGAWTVGFLLVGTAQASTPSGRGGTILVAAPTILPFVVPPTGASLLETVPFDPAYVGTVFDLQVVEADPGAQYGLSFTAGLELKTGR
jgi:Tol biopolymer transport system component